MGDNENEDSSKSLVIFGRDVSKIPCFRSTMLSGILGGVGMGLGYFLFTSRVKASADFSVLSFTLISLGYWVQCRYNYGKTKFEMMRYQEAVRNANIYEGSALENELKNAKEV